MNVDKERAKKVLEYVNNSSDYTFRKFAEENNLMSESIERIDDLEVSCVFHEDAAPSLSFNDKIHAFHCFSCGRHGSYLEFLLQYDTEVLGVHRTFYGKLNSLLVDDPQMQMSLGFNTIYRKDDNSSLESISFERPKCLPASKVPASYLELADLIKKSQLPIESIKLFILLMQDKFPVLDIYKTIFGFEDAQSSKKEAYSINDILGE